MVARRLSFSGAGERCKRGWRGETSRENTDIFVIPRILFDLDTLNLQITVSIDITRKLLIVTEYFEIYDPKFGKVP